MALNKPGSDCDAPLVLVTRPAAQVATLQQQLELKGLQALSLPMLALQPLLAPSEIATAKTRYSSLPGDAIAIFISTNAVHFTRQFLEHQQLGWSSSMPCLAVGKATAKALEEAGFGGDTGLPVGSVADSEHLLQRAEVAQVQGNTVALFRGVGGRELIADTLRERGADVVKIEVYHRVRPQYPIGEVAEVLQQNGVAAISVASGETLQNFLYHVAGGASSLPQTVAALPIFVPSARVAALAQEAGFQCIVETSGTVAEDVAKSIAGFFSR